MREAKRRSDLTVMLMAAIPMIAVIGMLWAGWGPAGEESEGAGSEGVVFVNGEAISRAEFEAAMSSLPDYARVAVQSEGGRKALAEQLIRQKLFVQEARRRGLHTSPEVAGALDLARDGLLAQRGVEAVAEEANQKDLESIWPEIAPDFEQARAEQIVIGWSGSFLGKDSRRTEAKAHEMALEVSRRARAGEDFEALRKEYSDDKGSDGSLGVLTRDSASPDIVEPLFALDEGEVSEPIKTQFGWHVLRMISRTTPPFEQVRATLEADPGTAFARAVMRRLRDEAEVEFDDEFFANPFGS